MIKFLKRMLRNSYENVMQEILSSYFLNFINKNLIEKKSFLKIKHKKKLLK